MSETRTPPTRRIQSRVTKVDELERHDVELGWPVQPAELAGAYVLLASDLGSYMTGAVIPVTGGEISGTLTEWLESNGIHSQDTARQ